MAEKTGDVPAVGDEVDVIIDSIAFGGEGVARYGGYVVFVPDVIPGEKVRVRVTVAKRSFGRGVRVSVIDPSPERVDPPCPVYGLCGGCQYQHVSYEKSLEFKEQQMEDVLLRIGGISAGGVCDPIRPAPAAYGYRSVVSLRVIAAGEVWQAGYFARDNETFVPISNCPIASDAINEAVAGIGSIVRGFSRPDRVKKVTIKHSGAQTVCCPDYGGRPGYASGERLRYTYNDMVLEYGARSFFQVNHAMIPVLVDLVGQGLGLGPEETLFDLYAGVGLFSLVLAGQCRRVVGIERGRESVECFRANIEGNKLQNVIAIRGAVEATIRQAYGELKGEANSILMDPPREGVTEEVIRFLNEASVRRLVYVSCDPSTLARDLKRLKLKYSLRKVTPLDMFPQTGQLEAVAVLEVKL